MHNTPKTGQNRRWRLAGLLFATATLAQAQQVSCTYSYGGTPGKITARPTTSPYTVPANKIGSYFSLRIIFQVEPADLAAITLHVYDERDTGPALVHQARHPYPPAQQASAPYGFTGLNFVHASPSESELQYWCRLEASPP